MISVVIPAKDEEDAIASTIRQVNDALPGLDYEIIIVDDGSQDATVDRAKATGATVISHPHNLGYGASLKTGIRAAKYDTIIITDADGTYPNDQIPQLLEQYNKGFDMVVGARGGQNYHESILKMPMRLILKFLVEYTTGRKVPDVNSGLRVFSKGKVQKYFNHLCNTFSFTTSMTLVYMMDNLFVSYIPIDYHKRAGKTKVRLLRDSLRTLQYIVEAITYYNPLKLFLLICFILVLGSVICLVLNLYLQLNILFYISVGGLLMSVQVFCMGLLALLLKQITIRE